MKTNRRQGIVDLWRFFAILLIMAHHSYTLGIEKGTYHFYGAWIYVEFFFILSGYFTMVHFEKCNVVESVDGAIKTSILYTVNKFKVFIPYVVIAVLLCAITSNYYCGGVNAFFSVFGNVPFEMLLLNATYRTGYVYNIPLWFLSSMLIVFPFFCCLCQTKHKNVLYLSSFYISVLFYGYTNVSSESANPVNLLRCFSGLMLGVLVYALAGVLRRIRISDIGRVFLTIIEESCLLFAVLAVYNNWDIQRNILFCFVIGLTIIFSSQSYASKLCGKVFDWLGKISMPIYILHWLTGTIIKLWLPDLTLSYRVILYYITTLLIAVLFYMIIEWLRKTGGKSFYEDLGRREAVLYQGCDDEKFSGRE